MTPLDPAFPVGDLLFRSLLESAPDAMVVIDANGAIVLVNSRTSTMFGYPPEELLGQLVEMLVPDRFRAQHSGHRKKYASRPYAREMGKAGVDLYGIRKNGEEFPIEVDLSPIETNAGMLVSSLIRDVSERKRVERLLQEQTVELQRLRVFQATMRTVQDIVNNFLNELQLVHLEAEDQLPPEMLTTVEHLIEKAAGKLRMLGDLEKVVEKEMAIGPGIDYTGSDDVR
jgi:PAS domain S-box-containing protein